MTKQTIEAVRRADRVLIGLALIVVATASAAIGAATTYHPYTDKLTTISLAQAPAPAAPSDISDVVNLRLSEPDRVVAPLPVARSATVANAALLKLMAEHRCLSQALYYEARGEGARGQMAIAEVIFHRLADKGYPHSICGIVYEGARDRKNGCQFSFACNGALNRPKAPHAWAEAQLLAAKILTGAARLTDMTEEATNFHTISVSPDWSSHLVKTIKIGNHIFYREPARSRPS